MSIQHRGKRLRDQKRRELEARIPSLRRKTGKTPVSSTPPSMPTGKRIVLGRDKDGNIFSIPEENRSTHSFIIGSPKSGKSVFMTNGVRQDICNHDAVILLDPHSHDGDSVLGKTARWLVKSGYAEKRTVHLFDPASPSVIGFNPLAVPEGVDPSVIAAGMIEAVERGWDDENTQEKPTLRRGLRATFIALAELGLSVLDAELLLDPADPCGVRTWALATLKDPIARSYFTALSREAARPRRGESFEVMTVGVINRIEEFTSSKAMRRVFGQRTNIDMCDVMDKRQVLLVALGGGSVVYEREADLIGRMMLRSVLAAAKRRKTKTPCQVWVDEAPRLLSGDVPVLFEEVRKHSVSLSIAMQTLSQTGMPHDRIRESVMSVPQTRIVFRLNRIEEASMLAKEVVKLNLELPVAALTKPVVVGYEIKRMHNESAATGQSIARNRGETDSTTQTASITHSKGGSSGVTDTKGTSYTKTKGTNSSVTESSSDTIAETESVSTTISSSDAVQTSETTGGGRSSGGSHSDGFSSSDSNDRGQSFSNTTEPGTSRWPDRTDSTGRGVSSGTNSSDGENWSDSDNWSSTTSDSHTDGIAETEGHATTKSHTDGVAYMKGESESESHGTNESVARSRGNNWNTAVGNTAGTGRATTTGITTGTNTQNSAGFSETMVPILEDRPGAVHSMENVVHIAAEAINHLQTGYAIVKAMVGNRIEQALIRIPWVEDSGEAFPGAAREYLLCHTPAAISINEADQVIADRHKWIRAQGAKLIAPKPAAPNTPKSFRVSGERWANNPQRKGGKPPEEE
jgi:hypothetical protein